MKMYQNQDLLMFLLEQCNLVNNNYQQASKVLFTFVANKQFGQLINISPHSLIMLNKKILNFYSSKYGSLIKIASSLNKKIMRVLH